MPLLRHSLYSQNVNLYLAPTADFRDTWLPLMRTVASEGRCFVLSANQCMARSNLPAWITGKDAQETSKVGTNGDTGVSARRRRKSTTTEDGHEIALPESTNEESSPRTSRRKSCVTADGNEIALPESVDEEPGPRASRRKSCVTTDGNEIALPDTLEEEESATESSQPKRKLDASEYVSRGGSCIISPLGEVLKGPLWDDEDGLLFVDADFDDCLRGRLDLDLAGSYSRYDLSPLP